MRENWLSNRIFNSNDDILDHCCFARNTLIDLPQRLAKCLTPASRLQAPKPARPEYASNLPKATGQERAQK